jgi:hypothetical protein
MAIGSANYPQPVEVNGFLCRNCTDVDNAKKHIDPAHPRSGPYGIDAATDPTNPKSFLLFGGSLATTPDTTANTAVQSTGRLVDIQV